MIQAFLNTQHYNLEPINSYTAYKLESPNFIGKVSSILLAPAQFFLGGRKVALYQNEVVKDISLTYQPVKRWVRIALAIIALATIAPAFIMGISFIIGITFKAISLGWKNERKALNTIASYYNEGGILQVRSEMPIRTAYEILRQKYEVLQKQMVSKEVWKNQAFIALVSDFMSDAERGMHILFRDLQSEAGSEPKKMLEFLTEKKLEKKLEAFEEEDDIAELKPEETLKMVSEGELHSSKESSPTPYLHYFFRYSLFEMYHMARRCAFYDQKGQRVLPHLTAEDEAPYSEKGTSQHDWKDKYNACCNLLVTSGIKPLILPPPKKIPKEHDEIEAEEVEVEGTKSIFVRSTLIRKELLKIEQRQERRLEKCPDEKKGLFNWTIPEPDDQSKLKALAFPRMPNSMNFEIILERNFSPYMEL